MMMQQPGILSDCEQLIQLAAPGESVQLKVRPFKAKIDYSDTFWHFLSLQRVQHKKVVTPPEVRRQAPVHMRYKNLFMLPCCKR